MIACLLVQPARGAKRMPPRGSGVSTSWRGPPGADRLRGRERPSGVSSSGAMPTEPLVHPAQQRFGRYRVVDRLGDGAMGVVFRAHDEQLDRDVALKTLGRWAGVPDAVLAPLRERFEHEARAIGALSHPNIVRVFDVGVEDDTPYLVMELIDGLALRKRIDESGALAAKEVLALGEQIARALEHAHAAGILHRDVKPANVVQARGGEWKLADFGIAHLPDSTLT